VKLTLLTSLAFIVVPMPLDPAEIRWRLI